MKSLERLERFASGSAKKLDTVVGKDRLIDEDIRITDLEVLAFDQALAKTGWVRICGRRIMGRGIEMTEKVSKGFDDTFCRVDELYDKLDHVVDFFRPDVVVYEMPSVKKSRVSSNISSSLVAATVVRCVAQKAGIERVMMIQSQQAKHVLTGVRDAPKSLIKEVVEQLFPQAAEEQPWNSHIRDAVALAVTAQDKLAFEGKVKET